MIIDLQRRLAEAGRIRIGQQVQAANGKMRPEKLDTFRLTTPDQRRIEQAAGLFGGRPTPWTAPAGPQWELLTTTSVLNVIVPPADMAFSQHYELWSRGGCQRRCDGRTEQISEGPCLCDPEQRECDIHTRLSVLLADLPGLGVWRIDTQGYYAAAELQGAVEVIRIAAGRGQMLPARLRLEQRQIKRTGPDGKPQTRNFAVPVLDIEVSPGQLLAPPAPQAQLPAPAAAIDATAPAPLTPVPATVTERPAGSVAAQLRAEPPPPRPRRNATQPVPPTGLQPRTTTEAQAGADEDEDPTQPGTVSKAQITKLQAIYHTDLGLAKDDRPRIIALSERIIGRELTGPARGRTHSNLSRREASTLIKEIGSIDPATAPALLEAATEAATAGT